MRVLTSASQQFEASHTELIVLLPLTYGLNQIRDHLQSSIQINLFIRLYKAFFVFVAFRLHSASPNHIEIHTSPYGTAETVRFCAIPIFAIHPEVVSGMLV